MNNETIYAGAREVASLMVGDMGIKSVFVGPERVYERPGGYIYIKIISNDEGES